MSTVTDPRELIRTALQKFRSGPLLSSAMTLFAELGYRSDRRLPINTVPKFREQLDPTDKLTAREIESLEQLKSLHLLFQLTDAELTSQKGLFDDLHEIHATRIESYLFFAAELPAGHYTRTALSTIVRAINKPLPMPALVMFRHGETISIGIIHRRLHKRDQSKDVLEKVTLIKDIACDDPIRAHLEILNDFALTNLTSDYGVHSFFSLHEAWQKRLGSYALSNEFYREIADWYFWAHHQVEDETIRLPQHCDTEQEKSLFLIRLLTRVIFCWFLVEKRLIPSDLFREHWLKPRLKGFDPSRDPKKPDTSPAYYRAILQNLFFGTLNMPPEQREFREKKKEGQRYDKNFGITNLWRYESEFRDAEEWSAICKRIPFLNGGLFDCLDDKPGAKKDNFILDGFSDNPKMGCDLPNDLFFGPERTVDLSRDYRDTKKSARSKKAKVRGLIEILSRYKFTVEENTPLEEEIALDPELLGKVFENLLASFNEDTQTTARKALGAFYTPREIVNYMVDEALKSYMTTQVPRCKAVLDDLFSNKATLRDIKLDTRNALIAAIGRVKILDPACGSGAFPMGALHRLVDLLQKLDPNNESWKRDRLAEALRYREMLGQAGGEQEELAECEARIADIEKSFDSRYHALDFARKLYLIENCIYGIDIQPIATQIAKLRFFISLIVDQKVNPQAHNLGVRPLPNLETRIVAADALIPIEKSAGTQLLLKDQRLDPLERELERVRHEHFNARNPAAKRRYRTRDGELREQVAEILKEGGMSDDNADKIADWDPYDQNTFAPFFDSEWMFGLPAGKVRLEDKTPTTLLSNLALNNETGKLTEITSTIPRESDSGFDIVIGNPPYVRQEQIKHLKPAFKEIYECFTGTADLYVYFYEAGIRSLKPGGVLAYISSNSFLNSAFAKPLRAYFTGKTRLLTLLDFGETGVFKAITEPAIVILQRGSTPGADVLMLQWNEDEKLENISAVMASRAVKLPINELKPDGWRLVSGVTLRVLDQMRKAGKPLAEYVNDRFYYGIKTGLNEAFVVDRATRDRLIKEHRSSAEVLKPFVRGRDVSRWRVDYQNLWLIFTRRGIDIKKYPAILNHLKPFKARLTPGIPGGRKPGSYEWYEIQDNIAYWQEFAEPKIVYQDIARYFGMAWDESGAFLANTCYFIPGAMKWMLGVLLSAPMLFYVQKTLGSDEGGFIRLFSIHVGKFPIPTTTTAQQIAIEKLVNQHLYLESHFASDPTAQTTRDPLMVAYWEQVLNGLVYELYFPEELHAAGLRLFDLLAKTKIPQLEKLAESKKLSSLRDAFEDLYDPNHLLRISLQKLSTLDSIRIIEGKA